jgi:hypothetical protein
MRCAAVALLFRPRQRWEFSCFASHVEGGFGRVRRLCTGRIAHRGWASFRTCGTPDLASIAGEASNLTKESGENGEVVFPARPRGDGKRDVEVLGTSAVLGGERAQVKPAAGNAPVVERTGERHGAWRFFYFEQSHARIKLHLSLEPAAGSAPTPLPTCGTNGQAPCEGGQCAPSHQLTAGTCVACGGDGEKYCEGADGRRTCKDGHRLDATKCVACGANGQTYCADTNGSRFCTAGTRLDGNTAKCVDCGGNGETYCADANGTRSCDPGHRLDSNTATCKVCGADGQTYCADRNGARFCTDGHRLDSNAATCRVCGDAGQTYCADTTGARFCKPGLRLDTNTATCVR